MQKYIFIFIFSLTSILQAQNKSIEVHGNAHLLANTPVYITQYSDYITQSEIVLSLQDIGPDGRFYISIPNATTGEYILHIGNSSHSLILEPGTEYNLEIPDAVGAELYSSENDTTLILNHTSNLDYQVNYFSINNYDDFARGTIKNKLKKFIDSMDIQYGYIKDVYFKQYKEYKMAELMANAHYKNKKTLFISYLKAKPVLYNHTQYMAFFNELYTGLMVEMIQSSSNSSLKNAINTGTPVDTVLATIQRNQLGDDPVLAELICLKGLFELYYLPGYDKFMLENLVFELKGKSNTPEIKNIASNFLLMTKRLKPGGPVIPFEGKDTEGNIHQLNEFVGKDLFLTFFSTDDAASIREIKAIKNLYDEYRKDINFVSVCTNCTNASLLSFIKENKLKWTFLIVSPAVEKKYEIVTYPTAFFIDKDGIFIMSPAPLPSAGVSNQIYLYLKGEKPKNR